MADYLRCQLCDHEWKERRSPVEDYCCPVCSAEPLEQAKVAMHVVRCDVDGCRREATCGTPTDDGYLRCCGRHFAAMWEMKLEEREGGRDG